MRTQCCVGSPQKLSPRASARINPKQKLVPAVWPLIVIERPVATPPAPLRLERRMTFGSTWTLGINRYFASIPELFVSVKV